MEFRGSSKPMAEIRLQNLTKRFGEVTAVDNLSLEIADREFLVLVGPSGCGKSTVLRCIAGLEELTGGEIFIGDRRVNTLSPKDRDVAMVFQNYALYPHMNVRENLAFGLRLRTPPHGPLARVLDRKAWKRKRQDIDRRVQSVARMLELQEVLGRRPKALSGGQRQRVASGAGHRPRAQGVPDGRTPLQPGCQVAGGYPDRARQAPPQAGSDHGLRDP